MNFHRAIGRPFLPLLAGWVVLLGVMADENRSAVKAAEPARLEAVIGVNNTCKTGCWTEARVVADQLRPGDYTLFARLLDADGNFVEFSSLPITVGEDGQFAGSVPIRFQRIGSPVEIRLVPNSDGADLAATRTGRVPAAELRELRQSQPWIVAVEPVGSLELTTDFVPDLHVSTVKDIHNLPENFLAWEGIDVLFLPSGNYSDAVRQRIFSWVQAGGSLVVFPNEAPETFLQSPLLAQLPVRFEGTAQVRDLSRLVSFVGEPSPLRFTTLTLPRLLPGSGNTLVGGLSGSVVTVQAWGLGQLTMLALPLNDQVFQTWDALPQLYRLLAELPSTRKSEAKEASSQLTQNGLTDFKTQWDAAIGNFGIVTPNIWLPLGSLLLAAILVGPFDYFVVRRLLQRPSLTWVTFPLLVLTASAWGLWETRGQLPLQTDAAGNSLSSVLVNQCSVLDYAAQTGTLRHQAYVKTFAPETGRYQVAIAFDTPVGKVTAPQLLGPGGVPEPSFRGYYRQSGSHLDQTTYQIDPHALTVTDLPIYEQSTALLELRGANQIDTSDSAAMLVSSDMFSPATAQLRGTLSHRFEAPIVDWVIAYGRLLYFVADDHPAAVLDPGEVIDFSSAAIGQRELSAFLTGTTTQLVKRTRGVGEDLLVKRIPYNPFSNDLQYILSRITFHKALGGFGYTSLTNVELKQWDLSGPLALNQAVLIGRLQSDPLTTRVDGQQVATVKNETFVRLIVPVRQQGQVLDRLPEYKPN